MENQPREISCLILSATGLTSETSPEAARALKKALMLIINPNHVGEPNFQGRKVAYIEFASEQLNPADRGKTDENKTALTDMGCVLHIIGKNMPREDILEILEKADFVFWGGGNTQHVVDAVRSIGLEDIIKDQLRWGKPYVMCSASACAAARHYRITMFSDNQALRPTRWWAAGDGLQIISEDWVLPHYDPNDPKQRFAANWLPRFGFGKVLPIQDGHFIRRAPFT